MRIDCTYGVGGGVHGGVTEIVVVVVQGRILGALVVHSNVERDEWLGVQRRGRPVHHHGQRWHILVGPICHIKPPDVVLQWLHLVRLDRVG